MSTTWKIARAMIWKEYRQSRGMLIVGILLGIFMIYMPMSTYQKGNPYFHINYMFEIFALAQGLLGFSLAALMCLTLFSVEMEKKTHVFLAMKPGHPDWMNGCTLLTASILAVIPILISILFFFLCSYPVVAKNASAFQNISYANLTLLYLSVSLTVFYGYGCSYALISSMTTNRIRSFVLALLLTIVGTLFLALLLERISNAHGDGYRFFEFLYSGYRISPFMTIWIGCTAMIPLALGILRFQMIHSLHFWKGYVLLVLLFLMGVLGMFWINVSDRNFSPLSLNLQNLNPSAMTFYQIIQAKQFVQQNSHDLDHESKGNLVVTKVGDRARFLSQLPSEPQPVRIVVRQFTGQGEPKILWDKSVLELVPEDALSVLNISPQNLSFFDRESWNVFIAQNKILLTGHIDYHPDGNFHDARGNRVRQETPKGERWLVMGYLSIQEPVQFTPLQSCVLEFIGMEGLESHTIACTQPGIFSWEEFAQVNNTLRDAIHAFNEEKKSNHPAYDLHANYFKDAQINSSFSTIWSLWSENYSHSDLDDSTNERLFFVDSEIDRTDRFWPMISCFDLSQSDSIAIYAGCEFNNPFPLQRISVQFGYYLAGSGCFAVEGDRMLYLIPGDDQDMMIWFDISQPQKIREITRISYPHWFRFSNWEFTGERMTLDNSLLTLSDHYGTYIYQVGENYHLEPLARKISTRLTHRIQNSLFSQDCLSILWDDGMLAQYELVTASDHITPDEGSSPYLWMDAQNGNLYSIPETK